MERIDESLSKGNYKSFFSECISKCYFTKCFIKLFIFLCLKPSKYCYTVVLDILFGHNRKNEWYELSDLLEYFPNLVKFATKIFVPEAFCVWERGNNFWNFQLNFTAF